MMFHWLQRLFKPVPTTTETDKLPAEVKLLLLNTHLAEAETQTAEFEQRYQCKLSQFATQAYTDSHLVPALNTWQAAQAQRERWAAQLAPLYTAKED